MRIKDESGLDPSAGRLSRRGFIRASMSTLAAASGRSLGAGTRNQASDTSGEVMVGAHLWVYASTQAGYDPTPVLETVFADMSAAGLDCVELMHHVLRHDDAVERIGGLIQKYGLPVIGSSFDGSMWNRTKHAEIFEEADKVITRLSRLGGRTLGTSVGRAPAPKTVEQLDAQAEMLRRLIALCSKHGVVLNLHNHTYEVENNEHDLRGTLERIPDVKLGPDLNWLLRAGVDPVDFILRYGSRIVFLHLRDQQSDGKWAEAMGEGDMDYAAIGNALRKIKFSGDAMIELAFERGFQPTRPIRESLRMSREYVRRILGF